MKKSLCFIAVLLLVIGCNKSNQHNPFAGTKWSAPQAYSSNFYVLTFSDNEYNFYDADENLNFKRYLDTGTYTFEENSITANSSGEYLSSEMYSSSWIVLNATLSVDLLTVRFRFINVGAPTPEGERELVFTRLQ